jgi:hypothetical protein
MNVLEIMTAIRNIPGLETEQELETRVLLRSINLGYRHIVSVLQSRLGDYLNRADYVETVSGITFIYPENCMQVISIKRDSKLCSPISSSEKNIIGVNINYPSDVNNPFYIDNGSFALIYPVMTPGTVTLYYIKYPTDLLFGYSSITGDPGVLVLNDDAKLDDDYYNMTRVAIYQRTGASLVYIGSDLVTDYLGSTRQAYLSSLTAVSDIIYAFIPNIPEKYHRYIVDAALIEIGKLGLINNAVMELSGGVLAQMLKGELQNG